MGGFGWVSAPVKGPQSLGMGASQSALKGPVWELRCAGEGVTIHVCGAPLSRAPGGPCRKAAAGCKRRARPRADGSLHLGGGELAGALAPPLLLLRSSACRAQHCRVQMVFVQPCPTSPLIFQLLHTCTF